MATTTRLVPAGPHWVDFGSAGHPATWYTAVRAAGVDGVVLDLMTPGAAEDYHTALAAGLQVQVFQGYWGPAWTGGPSAARQRGAAAVDIARHWGLPAGAIIWLDSEAWPAEVDAAAAAAWIDTWAVTVTTGHYQPGLYVGAQQPLDGEQLWALAAMHRYWRSASDVPTPAHRGYQFLQTAVNIALDTVMVDQDTATHDDLGSAPLAVVADPPAVAPAPGGSPDLLPVLEVIRAYLTSMDARLAGVEATLRQPPRPGTVSIGPLTGTVTWG